MVGAGRVRLHGVDTLRRFLRLERSAARRASRTCSRFHWKPLAAFCVDGATVQRAFEPTGGPRTAAYRDGEAGPPLSPLSTAAGLAVQHAVARASLCGRASPSWTLGA